MLWFMELGYYDNGLHCVVRENEGGIQVRRMVASVTVMTNTIHSVMNKVGSGLKLHTPTWAVLSH